jgi:hypothetical protein
MEYLFIKMITFKNILFSFIIILVLTIIKCIKDIMRIYWYCPLKMFTAFERMEDNPSFRLRCLNTHRNLIKNGFFSEIVYDIGDIEDPSIIIFMSFGEEELELAKWAKSKGVFLIHDYSENIRGIPVLEETKQLCDRIVCCSTTLFNLESVAYPSKVRLVKDPIEESSIIHNPRFSNKKLKVVWMGMGGNAPWVSDLLKPIVEHNDMEYIEISNREEANITWNRDSWQSDMASCDIALCPQAHWQFPAKSNVKVTTAMGLGLPVIASPIQSYNEIVKSEYNGFICHELEHWGHALNKLRSKELRELFVKRSREVLPYYSEEYIYREWEYIFKECIRGAK